MPVNFFIWKVVYSRRADIPAMVAIHRLIRGCPDYCVKSDNGLSKNTTDDEIGTYTVTLSAAKGLSRWAARCFAALSMTVLSSIRVARLLCEKSRLCPTNY